MRCQNWRFAPVANRLNFRTGPAQIVAATGKSKKRHEAMKRKTDPRHTQRVNIVKTLFEMSFRKEFKPAKNSTAWEVVKKQKGIDKIIAKNAPAWPIEQIAQMDLAALRLAIWELLYKKEKEPYKAIIDEAVEIAKAYGGKSSGSFVNGVLGSLVKSKGISS